MNELVVRKNVERDEDGTSEEAEYTKDVSTHLCEANEDSGIQSDLLSQLLFLSFDDWSDPSEDASADWWWSMFLVGVAQSWGVYNGVEGAEDAEKKSDEGSEAEGDADGSQDGILLYLDAKY